MTAEKLIENYRLLCKSQSDCKKCDMDKRTKLEGEYDCRDLIFVKPQAFIEVIENWSREHSVKKEGV